MTPIQMPIEIRLLKEEIFSGIRSQANIMGEIPPYPKTEAFCNLELHKAWGEYLDPVIMNIVKNVISVVAEKLEISIHAFEKRINTWNSISEKRGKYSAYNICKSLNNLPKILYKKDSGITTLCMKKFFHIENAYNYNSAEYIDKHYVEKIHTLYQKESLIKLKLLIAEKILNWINVPELIKKDCESAGFSLLKQEEDIFVTF